MCTSSSITALSWSAYNESSMGGPPACVLA
jgi:hypothetical protein